MGADEDKAARKAARKARKAAEAEAEAAAEAKAARKSARAEKRKQAELDAPQSKRAKGSPKVAPKSPPVKPKSPKLAPKSPKAAAKSPKLAPKSGPKVAKTIAKSPKVAPKSPALKAATPKSPALKPASPKSPTLKPAAAPKSPAPAGTAKAFREEHGIVVAGPGADCLPLATLEAAEAPVGALLVKAMRARGYEKPTPIQAQSWPIALSGRDMVSVAKTGSGKTVAFLVPALVRIGERGPCPKPLDERWKGGSQEPARPGALVLAPTRELAQQIYTEAESLTACVKAKLVCVYGGVDKGPQVGELRRGADIVVGTPGRVLDFLQGNPQRGLSGPLGLSKCCYLVLDEADRMLDMGFIPDITKIKAFCPEGVGAQPELGGGAPTTSPTRRQTLFFTATWPTSVRQASRTFVSVEHAAHLRVGQQDGGKLVANKDITQIVEVKESDGDKVAFLRGLLGDMKPGDTGIVFCDTKNGCDKLAASLRETRTCGWTRVLHSGKDQWEREETLATFRKMTTGGQKERTGVIVATNVAARGLDIPGVKLVVVYNFGGCEDYVHQIGRVGRAGTKGTAYCLFKRGDVEAGELVKLLRGAGQRVPPELEEIAQSYRGGSAKGRGRSAWARKAKGKGKGKGSGGGKGKGKGKGRW